jgi:DUF1680 family protein
VEITVESEGEFAFMLRIPAWCEEGAQIKVNGEPLDVVISPGSYVNLRRAWSYGDTINMDLPMTIRRIECHPYVTENTGRIALMRGPLLYCAEQIDNSGVDPRDLVLDDTRFSARFDPELLGGVVVLQDEARAASPDEGWENRLYRTVHPREGDAQTHATRIMAVPYYAWANREAGAMRVWLRNG